MVAAYPTHLLLELFAAGKTGTAAHNLQGLPGSQVSMGEPPVGSGGSAHLSRKKTDGGPVGGKGINPSAFILTVARTRPSGG